ncbi:MAG: glycosyltransferase [Candidatus Cloacimonetes bacterium]|nr:glycosyltransferase [Candidatus Cloacimonadota bacterium]
MDDLISPEITQKSSLSDLSNTNKKTVLVSVIIPTYNRRKELKEAVNSVLNQTYQNFEILIINDNGEDVSALLESYNDDRIRHFRHTHNKGVAVARNAGLLNAKGEYIAYLDDDDLYYPDHLKTLMDKARENPDCSVFYTDAYEHILEKQGENLLSVSKKVKYSIDFSLETLLIKNISPTLCFLHKRSLVEKYGYFDETLKSHEDWEFWLRLAVKNKFMHIKQVTCEFRSVLNSHSLTQDIWADFVETTKTIFDRYPVGNNRNLEEIRTKRILKMQNSLVDKKAPAKLVSIIIPVWNKVDLTRQCLENLFRNTEYPNYEVIVVDNASTDKTAEYLRKISAEQSIRVLTNKTNLGYARANNQAAKVAQGEYIVFLNNDTIPLVGWLTNLVSKLESDSKIGIVGSKLLYADNSIQHCGVVLRRDRKWFKHPYKFFERMHPIVCYTREWDAVTAACMITRKSLFTESGMFDEKFVNGCEDIDYCCAVRERGYKIFYEPKSELYHLESQTPRTNNNDESNFAYFISKRGSYAIKTEHEIYIQDGFWKIDGNLYQHSAGNKFVAGWTEKFKKAQSENKEPEMLRLTKLFRHLYTTESWSVESSPEVAGRKEPAVKVTSNTSLVSETSKHIEPSKEANYRILFVCHDFPPYRMAGAQLYARKLALEMNKISNLNVEVFYPVFRNVDPDYTIETKSAEGLIVHELRKPKVQEPHKIFDVKIATAFEHFLKEHKYDLIHFHGLGQLSLAPLIVADKLKFKSVMTFHDYWFLCDRWHMIRADQSICSGPESIEKCAKCYLQDNRISVTEESFSQAYNYVKYRMEVFSKAFGLISSKFAPSRYLAEKFTEFGYQGIEKDPLGFEEITHLPKVKNLNKIVFGYCGQIIIRKGVNYLIEGFSMVKDPDIELQIWGRLDDKIYTKIITELAAKDKRISLKGEFSPNDLSDIYCNIDIAIVPSLMENYPLVVMEAFQRNIPVIATAVGGIPEAVTNNVNGLLIKPGDSREITSAIEKICHEPQLIKKFSDNIPPIKSLAEDVSFYRNEYSKLIDKTEKNSVTDLPAKKTYSVQFYIYKNVHWAMFEELYNYLKIRNDVEKIIFCLPDLSQLITASNYEIVEKILSLGEIVTADPRVYHVDYTFIADTIAGKVKGCGKIINIGHGTISKGYYFTETVWTERENWVDLLCVPGRYAKEQFDNLLNCKVAATGMPKLDPVFSGKYNRKKMCTDLGLDASRKIVLYAPTFNIDLSSLYDFANRIQELSNYDFYLLIKLHGSTPPDFVNHYRKIGQKINNFRFIEDTNLAPYLAGADLMISDVSSAFMEFMALDKPVILYNNPNTPNYHGYQPENIEYKWRDLGTEVNSFDELKQVINKALQGDGKEQIRNRYAEYLFADREGKASENVWNECLKLTKEKTEPCVPVISIILKLTSDNLFAIREKIHNIQFYSVMPLELIIVKEADSEQIKSFLEIISKFNQFYKLKIIENVSDFQESSRIGLSQAEGDYSILLDESVLLFKNFDYILHKTFTHNPKVLSLTGVSSDCAEKYIQRPENMLISRYAYDFFWKYQGKEVDSYEKFEIPKFIAFRNKVKFVESYETTVIKLIREHNCKRALSLYYDSIPPSDFDTMKYLFMNYEIFPINERINSGLQVINQYFYSDIAELLWKDAATNKAISEKDTVSLMLNSVFMRFYDVNYKKEIINSLNGYPQVKSYLNKEIEIIEKLSSSDKAGYSKKNIPENPVQKTDSVRFLFFFFKNVHIPILLPVYKKLKEMRPEAEIAFSYIPPAPQIRAGLTEKELQLLKVYGVPLYDNPQQFHPDITFIADSVYPWVQNCGKLVNVGHGVLSKGQYYTDTETARREEQADLVCVPGKYHEEIMRRIISKPVVATGMAKLDDLFSGKVTKKTVCEKYHLPEDKKYLLFAPTFNDELSALPYFCDTINQVIPDGDTFLIIKLHGSTATHYKDACKKLVESDSRVIFADEEEIDLTPFLAVADVMISDVSSAMMEFAALDKPVILFNNPNWKLYKNYNPADIEFRWRDIGAEVTNLLETKKAVQEAFASPEAGRENRKKYSRLLFANLDRGDAAEEIIKNSLQLL